ncbi:hypothetical protein ACO0OL_001954 [Hanseniaspora opuntiae]
MARFKNYKFVSLAITVIMLIVLLRTSNYNEVPTTDSNTPAEPPKKFGNSIIDAINENITPLLQSSPTESCDTVHVIVIDAGSSGSRVHVYDFNKCLDTSKPQLLKEHFKMLKPGLSSFKEDFKSAAESLIPLLDFAKSVIPEDKQSCSPIVVKATAGLRMLGEKESSAILSYVETFLNTEYPFKLIEDTPVSIMGGDQEGVFAWITTNFLLGNIGNGVNLGKTAAIFDLGGGSTQIVFEPLLEDKKFVENEFKYDLDFGVKEKYELYQYSHLGYGLNEGRNKIYNEIINNNLANSVITKSDLQKSTIATVLSNPCLPPSSKLDDVKVKLPSGNEVLVSFENPSSEKDSFLQCRAITEKVLKKDSECLTQPCSFNGVHQPSLVKEFKDTSDLFVFSFFYDKTVPFGFPLNFNLKDLRNYAEIVCGGSNSWKQQFSSMIDTSLLKDEPELCMELTFQFELLHTGYEIPLERELKTCQQIDGNEIGWCLGVALEILNDDSSFKCGISKVVTKNKDLVEAAKKAKEEDAPTTIIAMD